MHIYLEKLQVLHFRNLENDFINFCSGINCIIGKNGNGKTNILEAIYFLINRNSFRKKTSFPQLLSLDCGKPEIIFSSVFSTNQPLKISKNSYSMKFSELGIDFFCNGISTKAKIPINTILINPFDSFSFHSHPQERRNWFDGHIGLMDPIYRKNYSQYKIALKQRNALIQEKPSYLLGQIRAINEKLIDLSIEITRRRMDFLQDINRYSFDTFKAIFDESHCLTFSLISKFSHLNRAQIQSFYEMSLEEELKIGKTKYGIYKDDYLIDFDGFNSLEFCSLGQQKMSFLSLIFAYIELFRYKCVSHPLVLIDDISGELDQIRWKRLINYLSDLKLQIIITTANEKFTEEILSLENSKEICVAQGKIYS